MRSALSVWQRSLPELEAAMTPISYKTWIDPMVPICVDDNTLVLEAQDAVAKNTLKNIYTQTIADCINRANGTAYLVRFIEPTELPSYAALREDGPAYAGDYMLNPKYTFESFIVGNSNNYAHSYAIAIADSPATVYNPLFIYGGVGLGKTHLMHAIGHRVLENDRRARIIYITAEAFTNELIQCIQENRNVQFRNKYRTADVLIIDDIQFLAGRDRTQEELFHTFNALHTSGKQIIISSDKPPKDLVNLEARLVSRFQQGLIVDIQPPDLETRIAILRRLAESREIEADEAVLTYIAEKVKSNIRQLEGALNSVIAYSRLTKNQMSNTLVDTALKDIVEGYENVRITVPLIQQIVADFYNIDTDSLLSQRRTMEVTYPRQVAMYLSKQLTDESLKSIGRSFGGRDHTTVISACNKIKEDIENNPKAALTIKDLTDRIKK